MYTYGELMRYFGMNHPVEKEATKISYLSSEATVQVNILNCDNSSFLLNSDYIAERESRV
jgi:hypothetical protein